ncbi:hypothetical protein C9424_16775 [Arthrobacter sp. H-02-3]|nr:hypothetical protein C9424_16775 [Arthrobacter sp. H-02-3]
MSALWPFAAFCVLLTAGATWAAWPLVAPATPAQERISEPETASQFSSGAAAHAQTSTGLYSYLFP